MFTVSPETDGYLPRISPVSSPGCTGYGLSAGQGDWVVSQHHRESGYVAVHYGPCSELLSEPLIPLPDAVLLHTDPALLLKLTQTYHDFIPPQQPVPSVDPPPAVLSGEGLFDASTEPAATSDHPLISAGLTGCPYRMTTYREEYPTILGFWSVWVCRSQPDCWVVPRLSG